MHIIVFFTYGISLNDWSESGLIDREVLIYKRLIEKYKCNITFITYGDDKDYSFKELLHPIKIIPIQTLLRRKINLINSIFIPFKIKEIIKSADILKSNQFMGSWVATISKILYKKKLLIRTGYDYIKFATEEKKSVLKILAAYILSIFNLIFASRYIVTSKQDRLFLNKITIQLFKNKIIVIPNWVNVPNKFPDEERYENRIISVGRLEKQKNYKDLIISLEGSDIYLDIFGKGSQKKYLEELAEKHKVNLNIFSNLSNVELLEKMKRYKIFASTSLYEGNSKVVLEAMAMGCLVITSDIENNQEIVKNNISGVVYRKDIEELKQKIIFYMKNDTERKELAFSGYEQIKTINSLNSVVSLEKSLYDEI